MMFVVPVVFVVSVMPPVMPVMVVVSVIHLGLLSAVTCQRADYSVSKEALICLGEVILAPAMWWGGRGLIIL